MEKIFASKLGFGSDYNNQYLVVTNGVKVVKADANKKPCLSRCLSIAKKSNTYVELCYQNSNGKVIVVQCWN